MDHDQTENKSQASYKEQFCMLHSEDMRKHIEQQPK
jgi:hypothetical protein